jgi:methylase of polypeptide subunit release factors
MSGPPEDDSANEPNLTRVGEFTGRANHLRDSGANEEAIKVNLFHYLPLMFPNQPAWLQRHLAGVETNLAVAGDTGVVRRFADSLVGLTSIEYEPDLRRRGRYQGGLYQVKEHCAGLLNQGQPADKLVGVLSDSVLWMAFEVVIATERPVGQYGPDDLELTLVGQVECLPDDPISQRNLVDFWVRFLGRLGSRPLNAQTIASDLGFDTTYGRPHMAAIRGLVDQAFHAKPDYAALIERLWVRFVAIAGSGSASVEFERENYSNELYLVTLAKLICANVLEQRALRSDDDELRRILNGRFFRARGLENLVEYDYFGWLSEGPHSDLLLPIARSVQEDLHVYDFSTISDGDVFGHLMAELGRRSHRLLLGQEFTPSWLCQHMAERALSDLPGGEKPRFIDMCCGSGAMLVAVTKEYAKTLAATGLEFGDVEAIQVLAEAATGFDIDPLAVLLAKVNWVVANRLWLPVGTQVSIPIYLADSLFAGIPFADIEASDGSYELTLHDDVTLELPDFLLEPKHRSLFDDLLQRSYGLTRVAAGGQPHPQALKATAQSSVDQHAGDLDKEQRRSVLEFVTQLTTVLLKLQDAGLNGLWAFILKNSYRPALVAGQFNGLISNPPWLALSKIADNPYGKGLREMAKRLRLSPPGPAHLHTELATTFLYASVGRYLIPGGVIVCILPDAVLNGYQHRPFREGAPARSPLQIPLKVIELWRVQSGTFKNEAIVLVGRKEASVQSELINGKLVGPSAVVEKHFRRLTRGDRVVWTDQDASEPREGFFDAGAFRQGADLMPRTLLFHKVSKVGQRWSVAPIDRQSGDNRYLVKDAKRFKDFKIDAGLVASRYIYAALLSNHLTPFRIADPVPILLPFDRTANGWAAATTQTLAADPGSEDVFKQILSALGDGATPETLLSAVESDRRKLSLQSSYPREGYLVVYGAGGSAVCAGARPTASLDMSRLVIDQTLYWHVVLSEDESLYLTGMFNSPAIENLIAAYQPQGQRGERHIHRLPALVTPQFDQGDPTHRDVVAATRLLVRDWQDRESDTDVVARLDPVRSLAYRRRWLRGEMIKLPSWEPYSEACALAYGGN